MEDISHNPKNRLVTNERCLMFKEILAPTRQKIISTVFWFFITAFLSIFAAFYIVGVEGGYIASVSENIFFALTYIASLGFFVGIGLEGHLLAFFRHVDGYIEPRIDYCIQHLGMILQIIYVYLTISVFHYLKNRYKKAYNPTNWSVVGISPNSINRFANKMSSLLKILAPTKYKIISTFFLWPITYFLVVAILVLATHLFPQHGSDSISQTDSHLFLLLRPHLQIICVYLVISVFLYFKNRKKKVEFK